MRSLLGDVLTSEWMTYFESLPGVPRAVDEVQQGPATETEYEDFFMRRIEALRKELEDLQGATSEVNRLSRLGMIGDNQKHHELQMIARCAIEVENKLQNVLREKLN